LCVKLNQVSVTVISWQSSLAYCEVAPPRLRFAAVHAHRWAAPFIILVNP
jgi:hypothetical protein